ncbi:hypothetical protein BDR04DRAFT_1154107 [Suillus decipiens]|nr:hypothetical protein BDR04DRAFT_1154107 [Suillus decipiens]
MKVESGRSKKPKDSKTSSETKQSQDDSVTQLLGITIATISTMKDLVPIALAQGILGTIANILTIVQSVIKNKSNFQVIADKCKAIREIVEQATKGVTEDDLQGYLEHALSQLNKSVNCMNSNVVSSKEQGLWRKIFFVTINRDRIAGWKKDLDRVLTLFNFEVTAGMAIEMKSTKKAPEHMSNVPRGLGIEITSADPVRQTSTFLRSANALVVLDNAETFKEVSASSALGDIPPAIAEMANIPGIIIILTSCSRRNALNV